MSPDFTYVAPDSDKYLKSIIRYLISSGKEDLASFLIGSKCSISPTSSYSGIRWNAMYTVVYLYVPHPRISQFSEEVLKQLVPYFDKVMPKEAGLDVREIEVSPRLDDVDDESDLLQDLEALCDKLSDNCSSLLPSELVEKGKRMAEVYIYIYCVENTLRLFIEKVANEAYGESYMDCLKGNKTIKSRIEERKKQESINTWKSVRGDSDLFYVDLKDLGKLIQNNWDIFKDFFPNQMWVSSKIDELGECRNNVAHNSYVDEHERDVIRTNYHSILRQLRGSWGT